MTCKEMLPGLQEKGELEGGYVVQIVIYSTYYTFTGLREKQFSINLQIKN